VRETDNWTGANGAVQLAPVSLPQVDSARQKKRTRAPESNASWPFARDASLEHRSLGELRELATLTLRYIGGLFIVTAPDMIPAEFKTRREARNWCAQTSPRSPIHEVGQGARRSSLTQSAHFVRQALTAYTAHTQQVAACNALHELEERLSRWLLQARDLIRSDTLPLSQPSDACLLVLLERIACCLFQHDRLLSPAPRLLQQGLKGAFWFPSDHCCGCKHLNHPLNGTRRHRHGLPSPRTMEGDLCHDFLPRPLRRGPASGRSDTLRLRSRPCWPRSGIDRFVVPFSVRCSHFRLALDRPHLLAHARRGRFESHRSSGAVRLRPGLRRRAAGVPPRTPSQQHFDRHRGLPQACQAPP
jgi:hypothetical protein